MNRMDLGLWQLELRAKKCVEALKKNGFDSEYLPGPDQLRERVLLECDKAGSIGFGGSMTIAELGIHDTLRESGKKLFDHGRAPQGEKAAARLGQLTCDLFLTSTNAVTLTGVLVNLDMNGNRTNAMTFGPKKILVVAGAQKVVADVEAAIRRIKTYVAPRNTKRLHLKTPCAVSGFCEDCSSPQRICRVYSMIERKPPHSDITVLLCGDPMGI